MTLCQFTVQFKEYFNQQVAVRLALWQPKFLTAFICKGQRSHLIAKEGMKPVIMYCLTDTVLVLDRFFKNLSQLTCSSQKILYKCLDVQLLGNTRSSDNYLIVIHKQIHSHGWELAFLVPHMTPLYMPTSLAWRLLSLRSLNSPLYFSSYYSMFLFY